ncbi:helix-turn-helix domain-containing protein [Antarctobacter jejuensis]|uniref:helix-turn-helix domain-containing protein n=1 Tax=Antarctobacter jejuensis TaxID=1439938 RepID=UPI003FD0B29C
MDALNENLYKSNMSAARKPPIETFALFGEQGDLPDIVHCETIQARSQINNWEFRPHVHARLHQVLLLKSGGGEALLETGTERLSAGSLVNIPAGSVHGFRFQSGTNGWVVTMASELLDQVLLADEGLRLELDRPAVLVSAAGVSGTVQRIFAEHSDRRHARAHFLRSLSALLLGDVARALRDLDESRVSRGDSDLRARFEVLLEDSFDRHLRVEDYARQLHVTPTHLSRVLRGITGRSASQIIKARIMREARRNLFFTNLGIAEIAYLLGYNDPAYFSRDFARATGMSPRAFRERVESASADVEGGDAGK